MRKQGLLMSTMILTAASLMTRTLGMVTIVAISQAIGAEGVGLYQLIMTIYLMAVMFASAGISVSVSKLVAEDLSLGNYYSARKVMRIAFCFSGAISSIVSMVLFVTAQDISIFFIKDIRAVWGIKLLALSIPFMSISSCFKGYFYAVKKAIKPASSDVLEQCVKLTLIFLLVRAWAPRGLEYACAAIGAGMTIGEIFSWSYLLTLYLLDNEKGTYSSGKHLSTKQILVRLLTVVVPIAAASYLGSILMATENVLIPIELRKFGETAESSMSLYGLLKGMVLPILFFPAAFLTAFVTTLIPEIARANALHNQKRVKMTTARVLHFTFMLGILVVSIFTNYAYEIGYVIYKNNDVGPVLRILSFVAPFMYIEMVSDGISKGLGQQLSCLKYNVLDSFFRISMICLLLPLKGIKAFIGIMMLSNIMTCLLNFNMLVYVTQVKIEMNKWIVKPLIAATASGLISKLMLRYLHPWHMGLTSYVVAGVTLSGIMYMVLLVLIESINGEDIKWLKNSLKLIVS